MLLKHRSPAIDSGTVTARPGFAHLQPQAIAVLRWLNETKIDYVLVGPVGHAIRGDLDAHGAVAIVPAPYGRNYDRLARALSAKHAGLRSERGIPGAGSSTGAVAVKLSGDKLARGRRWMLRFGEYDLDVERSVAPGGVGDGAAPAAEQTHRGHEAGARYQELLYEAQRFELMEGVTVEVASTEDLEHYSHVRRTGSAPEFRITRNDASDTGGGDALPADAEASTRHQADA